MSSIEQWWQTWAAFGVEPSPSLQDIYVQLIARYSEPHRHYHTVQHLAECFDHW